MFETNPSLINLRIISSTAAFDGAHTRICGCDTRLLLELGRVERDISCLVVFKLYKTNAVHIEFNSTSYPYKVHNRYN